MEWVFWISVALIAYVYAGYPLILYCGSKIGLRKPQAALTAPKGGLSIVIAARNEASRLAARLDNLLSLRFPSTQRQIIVVSDGSTDETLDVLARYRRFVEVVQVPAGGKALALNAGVARARFDIVVFADARQTFARDALGELLAPFADRRVGAVTGELRLDAETPCRRSGHERRHFGRRSEWREALYDRRGQERRRSSLRSTIADGVGLYWKYEKQLRRLESGIDSTLGATGAIYAVRRSLYRPLPADTILDDVLTPMRIVLAGYRVVFNEKALAFDRASVNADAEARRKIRTLAGNYQILALEPALLLPWRNRVWLQYVSHKIGRLIVPWALLAIFVSSTVLAGQPLYALALACQVIFLLLAAVGAVLEFVSRRRESAEPAVSQAHDAAIRETA